MSRLIQETLILASHNAGKLKEFSSLLADFTICLRSVAEFGLPEPEETGTTFEENAYIKASFAAKATGMPALADDSGLCVDMLAGAPGVYSADWAIGPDGQRDFAQAITKLETALQQKGAYNKEQRQCHFVCVICLAFPDGAARYFRGEVAGHVVAPPRGDQGFGYDPIFQPVGLDKTFAEISEEEKHGWKRGQQNPLSHRARAFKLFAEQVLMEDEIIFHEK